jgi:hypothetical protein
MHRCKGITFEFWFHRHASPQSSLLEVRGDQVNINGVYSLALALATDILTSRGSLPAVSQQVMGWGGGQFLGL